MFLNYAPATACCTNHSIAQSEVAAVASIMGKSAHPPRNHGKKQSAPSDDLASNVVFTNDTSDRKPGKAREAKDPEAAEAAATKRVETRKLIGGASWTGKLPVNMLSEHCQKQKWERPDYSMVRPCLSNSVNLH